MNDIFGVFGVFGGSHLPAYNPSAMVRQLLNFFDPHERQLVFQSTVIGVVVWVVVYTLKTAVHELSHGILHFIEGQPLGLLIPLVFLSLLLGALVVATLSRYSSRVIHYRTDDGEIHALLDVEGDGLERAISLYYTSEPVFEQSILAEEGVDVRWKMPTISLALRKFLATLATLGSGGSGGLEASVTLIGESLSAGLFKPRQRVIGRFQRFFHWWRPTDPDDLQTAQLSGIAAAVATLLGAPFTAAFFATEVMYRKRPVIEKLIYSLISALIAFFLNSFAQSFQMGELASGSGYFETPVIFEVGSKFVPPLGNWHYYVLLALMTISITLASYIFTRLRVRVDDWFHRGFGNLWLRHLTGAALTGLIAVAVVGLVSVSGRSGWFGMDETAVEGALGLVWGTGEGVIEAALAGELLLALAAVALLAKMLATVVTIGSGGSAGLLVPSLFFGTMIATIFAQGPRALGLPAAWDFAATPLVLIAPAMTASLVSIVNVPLAAILFAVEIFSGSYMIPSMITLVLAALFSHQATIYRTQRETFAKRQILPGYGARRIPVPPKWAGQTLSRLRLRQHFDVNVIGWVEQEGDDGLPHVRLSADANRRLDLGDTLVIIGREADLQAVLRSIESDVVESWLAGGGNPPTAENGRPSSLPEDL